MAVNLVGSWEGSGPKTGTTASLTLAATAQIGDRIVVLPYSQGAAAGPVVSVSVTGETAVIHRNLEITGTAHGVAVASAPVTTAGQKTVDVVFASAAGQGQFHAAVIRGDLGGVVFDVSNESTGGVGDFQHDLDVNGPNGFVVANGAAQNAFTNGATYTLIAQTDLSWWSAVQYKPDAGAEDPVLVNWSGQAVGNGMVSAAFLDVSGPAPEEAVPDTLTPELITQTVNPPRKGGRWFMVPRG